VVAGAVTQGTQAVASAQKMPASSSPSAERK
jgi:hypothetical protein